MQWAKMAALVVVAVVVSMAVGTRGADEPKVGKEGAAEAMQLPPGWTAEDMKACVAAGTPGKMHQALAEGAGKWKGKTMMWGFPGAEPMRGECRSTVTPILGGRYLKCEMTGDLPGMGPYTGFGIYGYDNVSGKFVSNWIDDQSTGIMTGVGEMSEDGKTVTWRFSYNCPITKKPAVMREVDTVTGPNSRKFEMIGSDPKSGKEFTMMVVEFTRE